MPILRKVSLTLLALVLIGIVASVIWLKPLTDFGAGYMAKQVCSCMFVGQRSFAACQADQPSYLDRIDAKPLEDLNGVHAELFPLSTAKAYYHVDSGCTIE